ncbi:ABC transporter ATP-binding protein [Sneathiella chinensis]|uniref:Sugar ABC transporter ATP-binding protein n=1 Tax=Sneathiella chinensis TaxID=349750 RepID=A0ABQ5U660_9PROT|nr:ABC transporter ATP-binding protein [Sneathiella chinensis]GLQ06792.1 sugar ABC transporter ATP-binding protein [Sneathiella chinensis]
MTSETVLELRGVSRCFGANTVLDHVDISVKAGSFTALLGASGCGKSTTLRIMAGLEQPSAGQVLLNGENVSDKTAHERNVAMVFQSYALYPHLTVAQNMALPLAMRHLSVFGRLPGVGRLSPGSGGVRKMIHEKVGHAAEILGLEPYLDRKPGTLSGGQKQRVALGRALVRDPVLFLLDEPLSNLDARLRIRMRAELSALHKETGRPFVYVTHDQAEAMAMADQVVVMIGGQVAQAGSPRSLYEKPASKEVAAFIGTNAINLFRPEDGVMGLHPAADRHVIGLRPEHVSPAEDGTLEAWLETAEFLGSEILLGLRTTTGKFVRAIAADDYCTPPPGSLIRLGFTPDRLHAFSGESGLRVELGA